MCWLFFLLAQTEHYTVSAEDLKQALRWNPSQNIVYPITQSHYDGEKGKDPSHRNFVNVWNENTPQWKEASLDKMFDR